MKTSLAVILAAVLGAAVAGQADAHHSFAMFDRTKTVVLVGTVKTVEWTNPHSWIRITGAGPDGVTKDWAIEGPSPNLLLRGGWHQGDVKPGDRVELTVNPLKDGTEGGSFVSVKLPSGKVMMGARRPE